jgi:hypothetical protein
MAAINPIIILDQYYYIDIFLTHTYKNLGQYDIIKNNIITGELKEFDFTTQSLLEPIPIASPSLAIVTGYTKSRLKEVISYSNEYLVGVKGVTSVNQEYVTYEIDGIVYLTYLDTDVTIYGFGKPTNEFEYQSILKDDNSVSVDVKKTLNAFVIDRSNISVYDYFNKISNCDSLDDLLDIF